MKGKGIERQEKERDELGRRKISHPVIVTQSEQQQQRQQQTPKPRSSPMQKYNDW